MKYHVTYVSLDSSRRKHYQRLRRSNGSNKIIWNLDQEGESKGML